MALSASDKSLLSSLALYLPIGLVLFVLFLILRLSFPRFYAARRTHGYPCPSSGRSLFGWWAPTMRYSESEMLNTHGLDAVMLLRVARTSLYMLLCLFFIGWVLIAPVNASGSNKTQPKHVFLSNCTCNPNDCSNCRVPNPLYVQGTSVISIANINPNSSSDRMRLWAHLVAVWLISIFGLFLLHRDWRAYADLRVRHLAQKRIATSSVMVQGLGVPHGSPLDESENAIAAYFNRLFPYGVTRVLVAAKAHAIDKQLKRWNKLIRKGERDEALAESEEYRRRKQAIRSSVEEMQDHAQAGHFGIVTFRSRMTASLVAHSALTASPDILIPRPAPAPHDVNWKAAGTSMAEQRVRRVLVILVAVVLILFWSIPVTFAASLTNISYLSQQKAFSWLRGFVKTFPTLVAFLSGVLPSLIVWVFFKLVLVIVRALARLQRLYAYSDMESTTRNVFFAFQFVNVLLVYTLSGALFRNLRAFLDALSFNNVVNLLAVSLPPQVNFFIAYVMTAAVLDQMIDLLRPDGLALMFLKRRMAKSVRDKEEAERPPTFDYAKQYAYVALFSIICLTYSVMSPLITLWGLLYCFLHYTVMKYNLLYTCYQRYEAGGRLWLGAFAQLAFGLVFFQMVMFGVFLTFKFPGAPGVLPLIPITIIVCLWMKRVWERPARQGALERLVKPSANRSDEEEGEETAEPAALHEGDYAQPARQHLMDDVIEMQ